MNKISEMRRQENLVFVKLYMFWLFVNGKKTGGKHLTIIRAGRIMDNFYLLLFVICFLNLLKIKLFLFTDIKHIYIWLLNKITILISTIQKQLDKKEKNNGKNVTGCGYGCRAEFGEVVFSLIL